MSRNRVMARVDDHLRQGLDHRAANQLAGYLSTCPTDLEAREKLAAIHVSMRNWTEAGRWGYFAKEPHPKAIKAFERVYAEPADRWAVLRWPSVDTERMPPPVRARFTALSGSHVASTTYAAAAVAPRPRAMPATRPVNPPAQQPQAAVAADRRPRTGRHEMYVHRAIGVLAITGAAALCGQALATVMEWLT